MLSVLSEERIEKIVEGLARKAEDGDLGAARLILSYTLGRPAEAVDPDRLDVDEAQREAERRRLERQRCADAVPSLEEILAGDGTVVR